MKTIGHLAGTRVLLWICALCVVQSFVTRSSALTDSALARLTLEQKLNAQVPLDLQFKDESGKQVRIGDLLGARPAILVLGYYECPMLCTMVMNGMVESLEDVKWSIGREFSVINVSINPLETPGLAAAKKRTYLKRYGRAGAAEGWSFLTGQEPAIRQLAEQVGFQYAYDQASKQYAHPSGLIVLTPQGKVAAYLFGVSYAPKDLFAALNSASSNKITSPIRKLILLCFHYNPITGKYGPRIMLMVRIMSLVTVIGLIWLVAAGATGRGSKRLAPKTIAPQPGQGCAASEGSVSTLRKEAR